jgi:hypothetical protein
VGADPESHIVGEIASLKASIDSAAAATETTLAQAPDTELSRQLAALRERVAVAEQRNEGAPALRAELATLLFFARTLKADADRWRSALEHRAEMLEQQKAAARRDQERLVVERERLARRRDALQSTILQTAARMAQQNRAECRRTLPVFTLADGLTVCSVSVSRPGRWFRLAEYWLVTLNRSQDVLVRRD